MVSWIEDEPVENVCELESLATNVTQALRDVVELTGKLTDSKSSLPDDLPDLPRELSFWIGAHLGGPVAEQQQNLLELTSTRIRLEHEFDMLDETRRQLAARTVLRDTFSGSDSSNG
jgi:ATP-dependent Lon protease